MKLVTIFAIRQYLQDQGSNHPILKAVSYTPDQMVDALWDEYKITAEDFAEECCPHGYLRTDEMHLCEGCNHPIEEFRPYLNCGPDTPKGSYCRACVRERAERTCQSCGGHGYHGSASRKEDQQTCAKCGGSGESKKVSS